MFLLIISLISCSRISGSSFAYLGENGAVWLFPGIFSSSLKYSSHLSLNVFSFMGAPYHLHILLVGTTCSLFSFIHSFIQLSTDFHRESAKIFYIRDP